MTQAEPLPWRPSLRRVAAIWSSEPDAMQRRRALHGLGGVYCRPLGVTPVGSRRRTRRASSLPPSSSRRTSRQGPDGSSPYDAGKAYDFPAWFGKCVCHRRRPSARSSTSRVFTLTDSGTPAGGRRIPGRAKARFEFARPSAKAMMRHGLAGAADVTSLVITLKLASVHGPNEVSIATSVASRPRAIKMRPMRGLLWRASNVYQRPPR